MELLFTVQIGLQSKPGRTLSDPKEFNESVYPEVEDRDDWTSQTRICLAPEDAEYAKSGVGEGVNSGSIAEVNVN